MRQTVAAVLAILALGASLALANDKEPVMSKAQPTETSHLTPMQKHVTQENGTEPPFNNAYWNHKEEGIYVDVITGEALFSSTDKFDSGTGWPSFTQPINANYVQDKTDDSHGMSRTEIRAKNSDAHLGHVFDDGPADQGGKRYCINSAALNFIPKAELAAKGYAEYLGLFYPQKAAP